MSIDRNVRSLAENRPRHAVGAMETGRQVAYLHRLRDRGRSSWLFMVVALAWLATVPIATEAASVLLSCGNGVWSRKRGSLGRTAWQTAAPHMIATVRITIATTGKHQRLQGTATSTIGGTRSTGTTEIFKDAPQSRLSWGALISLVS